MYKFYYHLGQNIHTWLVHTQGNSGKTQEKLESVIPFREGTRASSPSNLSYVFSLSYHVLILSILNNHKELFQIFLQKSNNQDWVKKNDMEMCAHDIV